MTKFWANASPLIAKHQLFSILLFSLLMTISCTPKQQTEEIIARHVNGKPKITHQLMKAADGSLQLIESHFFESGKLSMQGPLVDGKRNGYWKSWYEDGKLWSEGGFENGERQGVGIVYHANGQKHLEGTYAKGIKTGVWKSWDENGSLNSSVDLTPR